MERVQAIISQMMNSDDGLVVVMEKDSKVVGLIVGHFSEHPMFGTKCTTELVWYVDFNYRGTKDSLKLLKAYIEWAEYKGSELVFVSDLERKGTVERIYTKLGFTQVEISYARRL
jgi:GNAT superfamily N-acetyltransferase